MHLAINIIRVRMAHATFEVKGEPVDLEGATQLASEDPYQFQWWILGCVGARPVNQTKKKSADSGIDGEFFFRDAPSGPPKRVVISVKGGNLQPAQVRELVGVVQRDARSLLERRDIDRQTNPHEIARKTLGEVLPVGRKQPEAGGVGRAATK